ncbi:MAG: hypothetical protein KAR47_14005, partial [Planctomycetes bacterium]|nr:hypothetical protein [Planctomycetota bacterium]
MNPDPEATPVPYGESCGGGPGLIWDDIFLGYYLGHTGSNVAYWSEYQCPGLVTQPVYFSEIIGAGEYEINDVSFDGCYEDCAENAGCAQWSGGSDYGFFVDFDPSVFNISPVYWTGGGSFTVTLANTDCETLMAVENSPIKVYVECAVQGKCSSLGENGEGSCGCDYDDCWIEKYEYFLFG